MHVSHSKNETENNLFDLKTDDVGLQSPDPYTTLSIPRSSSQIGLVLVRRLNGMFAKLMEIKVLREFVGSVDRGPRCQHNDVFFSGGANVNPGAKLDRVLGGRQNLKGDFSIGGRCMGSIDQEPSVHRKTFSTSIGQGYFAEDLLIQAVYALFEFNSQFQLFTNQGNTFARPR